MKKAIIAVSALLAVAALVTACQAPKPKPAALPLATATTMQKASYGLGARLGGGLVQQKISAVPELVVRGFVDSYTGAKVLLTPQEARATVQEFQAQQGQSSAKTDAKPQNSTGASDSPLKTLADRISYVAGMSVGAPMKARGVALDVDFLSQGILDKLAGKKPAYTDAEIATALEAYGKDIDAKMADANQKVGDAFLAKNKLDKNVVVLPSGLQYKILKAGKGKKPAPSDSVVCNYRGTLVDGTEFDASAKHGGPATFKVTGVIPGWTEALKLMPVGSKWQLFIPGKLAYGPRGAGGAIGPNATLIFEIELISIKK